VARDYHPSAATIGVPPNLFINATWVIAREKRLHGLFGRGIKSDNRIYRPLIDKFILRAWAAMGAADLHH
jgi:hypothetical protein